MYKQLLFGVSSASELYQHEISTTWVGVEGVDNISDNMYMAQTKKLMTSAFLKPWNSSETAWFDSQC